MARFDVIGEPEDPNADVKPRSFENQGGNVLGEDIHHHAAVL